MTRANRLRQEIMDLCDANREEIDSLLADFGDECFSSGYDAGFEEGEEAGFDKGYKQCDADRAEEDDTEDTDD